MKINVIGTSGSGKSTLSRRLAAQLNVPYIEMDRLYWLPEWQGRSDEDFYALLEETLNATPGWVLDGNYNRSRPIKWRDVDLVIWLDYGFWRTLRQAVLRVIRRAWQGKELWPGTGNTESFRRAFLSRESILIWTLKTGAITGCVTRPIWPTRSINTSALCVLPAHSRSTPFLPV
jgi:GTPase SAR1 family protein